MLVTVTPEIWTNLMSKKLTSASRMDCIYEGRTPDTNILERVVFNPDDWNKLSAIK